MKAFMLHGKRDLRQEEIPYPEPLDYEVIVRVKCMGVCGSDVHYFQDGKIGSFIPKEPFALGHELAGVIDRGSPQYPELVPGTRVSINPSQPCNDCSYCKAGKMNLCPSMKYMGSASVYPHINGGLAQYIRIPGRNCYVLPDSVAFDEAALLEPLSIVLHAVSLAGSLAGKSVLITGGGTIGQICLLVSQIGLAGKVVVTDRRAAALSMAETLGAGLVVDVSKGEPAENLREYEPSGFDVLLEASGNAKALEMGVQYLKKGGKVIQLGMIHEGSTFPYVDFMKKELGFQTSFRFSNEYQAAFDLVAGGEIDLTKVITKRFVFDDALEALTTASDNSEQVKVVIDI